MAFEVSGVDIVVNGDTGAPFTEADAVKAAEDCFAAFGVRAAARVDVMEGPAGGWPCCTISFETEADAVKGMTGYWNGDEEEALATHLLNLVEV